MELKEGDRVNVVYSGDDSLEPCGVMTLKKFKSGTEGFSIGLPIDAVRKAMAKSKDSKWINLMGFKAKERTAKDKFERKSTASFKKEKKELIAKDLDDFDDEVPF